MSIAEPKPKEYLESFTSAAIELGIERGTVRDLVKRLGIIPKPTFGRANGLSPGDMSRLRKALDSLERIEFPSQ